MHRRSLLSFLTVLGAVLFSTATMLLALVAPAAALPPPSPCIVADNGFGTVDYPPNPCGFSSLGPLMIIDGLPAGSTIESESRLNDSFFDIFYLAGGIHGGQIEQFHGWLSMDMIGTGQLAGFHRLVSINAACETHSGPRMLGAPVQSFPHDLMVLQGQLPPGDPDFDLLRITAGGSFGMPSPGHTTLTRVGTDWNVDSFFDITYRIDFIGSPGSVLGGRSGSTTATIRMQMGNPGPVSVEPSTWGSLKTLYR
jgi:hypothetical protein